MEFFFIIRRHARRANDRGNSLFYSHHRISVYRIGAREIHHDLGFLFFQLCQKIRAHRHTALAAADHLARIHAAMDIDRTDKL